jgi:hypothetical protein
LFVNVYRLAASLGAQVFIVRDLKDGARLVPVEGGFRVLVSEHLPDAKFRCAVAHELAHTLFYSRSSRIPRQLQAPNKREEVFCFDVARRVLAPNWLVDACRLRELGSGAAVFEKLIDGCGAFRLSKPLAARVMLGDYGLAKGVAGVWLRQDGVWTLRPGMAWASRGLSDRERKLLRGMASFWLRNRKVPSGFQVIEVEGEPGVSAFVIILQEESRGALHHRRAVQSRPSTPAT